MVKTIAFVPWVLLCTLFFTISSVGCGREPPPELSEETKSDAVDFIKGELLVKDAAIAQDGHKLSLVVIINAAATEEYAKEVGENFVRYLKAMSPDETPGREVGPGIYDYLIGVYTLTEEAVAEGAKHRSARRISW